MTATQNEIAATTTDEDCKTKCTADETCKAYLFDTDKCYHYDKDVAGNTAGGNGSKKCNIRKNVVTKGQKDSICISEKPNNGCEVGLRCAHPE